MFKWLIAIVLLVLVLTRTPTARKLRFGDLPGDVRVRYKRLNLHLPFTSTLLVFFALYVLTRLF